VQFAVDGKLHSLVTLAGGAKLSKMLQINLVDIAIQYHEALPQRIRHYLNARGIPNDIINSNLLGWNGWRITIPIYNRQGEVVFFRLAKDPHDNRPAAKMISSPGSSVELYGWDQVLKRPAQIIICEGEFDRLVLEAQGFAAVTSTGGAATFRPEWATELKAIENVYICFDSDNAGRNGAAVVGLMIPHAKIVQLPEEVREGGDVTDFFVQLKHTREDFLRLLEAAKPASETSKPVHSPPLPRMQKLGLLLSERIQRVKNQTPIEKVIAEYVQLKGSGKTFVGRCPFHNDRVPSFTVYPATGTYHCFGCRAHGDLISFVAAVEHLSFGQALEVLDQVISHNGSRDKEDSPSSKAA
jgi:DNA primase